MSLFTPFSHIQNMSGVCPSQCLFSGNTTNVNIVTDTIYYRLLLDASGNPIVYGYYSINFNSALGNPATFISGTAPDGKNYAVYMTNIIDGYRYIICPVFRNTNNSYQGQGLARINTYFPLTYDALDPKRFIGIYQEWDSVFYPRPQLFLTVLSTSQIILLKYPYPCP
jgi:hypothetical protein